MLINILIIIICVILSICLILFINKDKITFGNFNCLCCKKNKYTNYAVMDVDKINNNIINMKINTANNDKNVLCANSVDINPNELQ